MSNATIQKVRTHGVLAGQDIVKDARRAKDIARLADEHRGTVSAQAVAREHVRRAMNRVAKGKGTSALDRAIKDTARLGRDFATVCDFADGTPEAKFLAAHLAG